MENRDGVADAVAEEATTVSPPVEIQAFEQRPSRFLAATQRAGEDVIPAAIAENIISNSPPSEIRRSHSFTSYWWWMMWIAQWFESANGQTEVELTSITTDSIPPRDDRESTGQVVMLDGTGEDGTSNPPATATESHFYSTLRVLGECLPLVIPFLTHSPIAISSIIFYVVAYGMPRILFWIYKRLKIPNLPHHNTILKRICCIFYVLIVFLLLVMGISIFLLHHHPNPSPRPQTHPRPHHDPQTHPDPLPHPRHDPRPQTHPRPHHDPRPQTHPRPHHDPQTHSAPRPRPQTHSAPRPLPHPHLGTHPDPRLGPGPSPSPSTFPCPDTQNHASPHQQCHHH